MKNRIRNSIVLLIILTVVACSSKEKEIPEGIIEENKMIEIFTEMELTQALVKLKLSNQDTIKQQQLFDQVFEGFDVSEEQFNESLAYYCEHPKTLEDMYVKVISNLSEKQAEIQ